MLSLRVCSRLPSWLMASTMSTNSSPTRGSWILARVASTSRLSWVRVLVGSAVASSQGVPSMACISKVCSSP
ncbi:hypothetical protein D3C76_1356350 [compost metagenome]